MTKALLRRFAFLLLSFTIAIVVIFLMLRLLPGDPSNALLSINATPEQITAARSDLGLNHTILWQFMHWSSQLFSLNFGTSYVSGLPVLPEIGAALQVTVPLTLIAFAVATVISIFAGFFAAFYSKRWFGIALSGFSQLGIAVPVFWIGLILVWIFALRVNWFPSGGFPQERWNSPGAAVHALILPIITVVLVMSAVLTRYSKSVTTDVLNSDYIRTSRAMGSSHTKAFLKHGLRNAAVPFIAVLGIELASTLLGAVVVESVFALPGLGSMLVKAIATHDYPNIQGILICTTFFVLVIGFLADALQKFIDPRLRRG